MKLSSSWSYAPYIPLDSYDENEIYICRIAPYKTSVTIDWFCVDGSKPESYTVLFGKRGEDKKETFVTSEGTITIDGLSPDTDYEFTVTSHGKASRKRLVRTGRVFGVVVNYLHPDDNYYAHSGNYLCSPSLLKLPDGSLLASMDVYGNGTPMNLTLIYKSVDGGSTWKYLSEVCPCFWGELFLHKGDVYLLGCSTEAGSLLIGKSTDGGKTFGAPTLLGVGSGKQNIGGWHKNANIVTEHSGRLWTAVEYGSWDSPKLFSTCVLSIPVDADLLDSSAWSITEPVRLSKNEKGERRGFIEGNVTLLPNGDLVNILRSIRSNPPDIALLYKIDTSNPEAPETPYEKKSNFPSHNSKFEIKRDPSSGVYYSIGTWNYFDHKVADRRAISLFKSVDGLMWDKVTDLIDIRDEQSDPAAEGVQYPSFEFDGDRIIWLCRTALNKPHNFHDSNYTTFHVIENFRNL